MRQIIGGRGETFHFLGNHGMHDFLDMGLIIAVLHFSLLIKVEDYAVVEKIGLKKKADAVDLQSIRLLRLSFLLSRLRMSDCLDYFLCLFVADRVANCQPFKPWLNPAYFFFVVTRFRNSQGSILTKRGWSLL